MTRQALPILTLHTSDCVTQPKGPVFTGLHQDGRMKTVEPGVRCSSIDVVVVGMQGMKHRVEWLTAFEEFKRAGSPQVAFAEGITDAKKDFEAKKIDVTYDSTKYLPIIVTNRGINITNVTVDKIHVVGLPHCGKPLLFLEEIWQMAAEMQMRKTTSIIDIVLYGPSTFAKEQKQKNSPTWELVMQWCEMKKLPKPSMASAQHVIDLGDSDEDMAEVSFIKMSRRERKDILQQKTERRARLEFRSIRSAMDIKDPSGTFFSQLTKDGMLAATKEPVNIIDIVMVGRPESQSDLVHTFEQTNLDSPIAPTWFMNSVELDAQKVNALPEYEYVSNNSKTYPVLLTNRGIRPFNVSVRAIHAVHLPDSTQSAFDTFMDEAVMTADAAAPKSRAKVNINLYLHQSEKDVARMLVAWASSRQWNLPNFIISWSKDPSEKCGKHWRKRAMKEMPEIASKAPALAKDIVDLMKHYASFTLTLGNEHVPQIELFIGTKPRVR